MRMRCCEARIKRQKADEQPSSHTVAGSITIIVVVGGSSRDRDRVAISAWLVGILSGEFVYLYTGRL